MSNQEKQKNESVMRWIYILAVINFVLGVLIIYLYSHQASPAYYAVFVKDGKPYPVALQPLMRPIINRQALTIWAGQAAVAAYTYDVARYEQELQNVMHEYFTDTAAEAFMNAFNQNALSNLLSKKLVVTAVVNGIPLILNQGLLMGRQTWRIQVPLLVNYQSASETKTVRYIVSMLVVQTDTKIKPAGIAIANFQVGNAL
jgi:intracellular multiplication protein IcmL